MYKRTKNSKNGLVLLICGLLCAASFYFSGVVVGRRACALEPKDISPKGQAYTTDSEISPYELFLWFSIHVTKPTKAEVFYIVAENPLMRLPVTCLVTYVLERVDAKKGKLTGYAYYQDGKLEVYELVPKNGSLDSGHFTKTDVDEVTRRIIDYYLLRFMKGTDRT